VIAVSRAKIDVELYEADDVGPRNSRQEFAPKQNAGPRGSARRTFNDIAHIIQENAYTSRSELSRRGISGKRTVRSVWSSPLGMARPTRGKTLPTTTHKQKDAGGKGVGNDPERRVTRNDNKKKKRSKTVSEGLTALT